jgi:hypothetical protein
MSMQRWGNLEGGEFHRVSFGAVVERIDILQLHKFLRSYTLALVGIFEPNNSKLTASCSDARLIMQCLGDSL